MTMFPLKEAGAGMHSSAVSLEINIRAQNPTPKSAFQRFFASPTERLY
jgi:hypothetical protein